MSEGLQAIRYVRGHLEVLDQLRLPHEHHYDRLSTSEEAFDCIKSMRVRGAPAIAIVAALAHGVELYNGGCAASTSQETISYINSRLDYLKQSRPTAVDLTNAITQLKTVVRGVDVSALSGEAAKTAVVDAYIAAAEDIFTKDKESNVQIGLHGREWLLANVHPASISGRDQAQVPGKAKVKISILTHCNTGSLATSGHGTALGIVRSLHEAGNLSHAFCTETRPYNQGSRLTAFELVYERIPSTLITDSMAATLFATKIRNGSPVAAVVVGADRVVRNGDTANKVGTYALAVLARHHGVRFVVAAPTTSIDLHTTTGSDINIEERKTEELTQVTGAVVGEDGKVDVKTTARVATAHQDVNVWNPAFDVTPADLIDAIVTERGVVTKGVTGEFDFRDIMPVRWGAVVGVEKA